MTSKQGKLNTLLQKWGQSHAPSPAADEVLRSRVLAALREQEAPPPDGSPSLLVADEISWTGAPHGAGGVRPRASSLGSGALSSKTSWLVLAAAASVLVATALWSWSYVKRNGSEFVSAPAPKGSSGADTPPPDFARLIEPQLQEKRTLLRESQRLFAGRVGWIAETGDRVRIDVVPDDAPGGLARQWLAVRLVVTRHTSDGTECPVWSLDLISSSQQLVRLESDSPDGADVMLWNYTLPDGMIAVDARLDVPDADPAVRLQASYAGLQESGVPTALYSWTAGGAEYEVYQTVTAMDDQVL